MKLAPITLLSLVLLPALGHAQSQCGYGVEQGGQCVPADEVPGYRDSLSPSERRPEQPQVEWANRYGAIAIDNDTSSVGVSENQTSESAASKDAMRKCASQLNSQHCEVLTTYMNACTALVWGKDHYGFARNINASVAQKEAFAECAKSTSDCKIFYAACSLPVRVQ